MAVLSAGGVWLPKGLTFGPTNGPQDFQELVFIVFQRRLYKDWFLFVDDLSNATGRKKCHKDGPSGAHDISCLISAESEGERGSRGLGMTAGSAFPSPFAHLSGVRKSGFLQRTTYRIKASSLHYRSPRWLRWITCMTFLLLAPTLSAGSQPHSCATASGLIASALGVVDMAGGMRVTPRYYDPDEQLQPIPDRP